MSAEAELNAVKKIEANKYCVNCDAYNKFGHGNICEKFKTFVCSNCKSAHQSFSMRVKSVSMSNWSKEEVDALREENGGGNAVAKRVWLGKWDESQMRKPTDKDHVDYFKKFINRVYNDRAFYDENGAAAAPLARKDSASQRRASPTPQAAASSAAAANLLDFSAPAQPAAPAFDAFASAPAAIAAPSSPGTDGWGAFASAPAPARSDDGFGDFGAFASAPPAAASTTSFDPFGSSQSATPAPAPPAQAFDPFGAQAFAAPAPVQPVSFDPFGAPAAGGSSAPAPALAPMGPPPGKNLSAFDELAAPNLAYGVPRANGMGLQQSAPSHFGHQAQPQGHFGHMGFAPQQHMGYQQQQQSMMMGANAGANISAFMAPHAATASSGFGGSSGSGFVRQAPPAGGRDPFAGLGLPQH